MTTTHDRPNNARMVDYVLGGSHHFAVDRQAADFVRQQFPEGSELVRAQRRFLQRAVTWMAEDRAIRRFLDFGSGLPSSGNVHEVVFDILDDAQVVYTDIDPITATYARDLLQGEPGVSYLQADVTDVEQLLQQPEVRRLNDGEPIGITLIGIGMYINPDVLQRMLRRLHDWAPAGSALALVLMAPPAADHHGIKLYVKQGFPVFTQTPEEIERTLGGWQMTPEGVVQGCGWRHEPDARIPAAEISWSLVATR